ncbi:TIM-barrel domain-containing protein [Fodinibius roseus]|nr:TIM-barrel domain-containing protein [Fodinibius roseus]
MANSIFYRRRILSVLGGMVLLYIISGCSLKSEIDTRETEAAVYISTANYNLDIQKKGFRYSFKKPDGTLIAESHPVSGLLMHRSDTLLANIESTKLIDSAEEHINLLVTAENGLRAVVTLWPLPHSIKFQVRPEKKGKYSIAARTAGLTPSFGLGDHAAFGDGEWDRGVRAGTDLTGIEMDPLRGYRMISNFVIFPKQGLAAVNIEPGEKIIRLTEEENLQGAREVASMPAMYYFIGSPGEIYQSFLDARNREGYPVYKPKYEWFGVGWEAFGALAWNTNRETVTQNINEYLDLGFPLEWMVVGSGFWPRAEGEMDEHGTPYNAETDLEDSKKLLATTSFGMWDEQLYPSPKEMIDNFHRLGLKFIIGLRTGFIPGGPFTDEGLKNGYFIEDEAGNPRLFGVGFPEPDVYIVDAGNTDAVNWYVNLCQKWENYGVDGYKEDLFGYPQTLPDDFVNPINEALMDKGVYVMGRNNYLGSPVDIHRYNDFNYNQPQDRGPINGLAYAYSGFPYVYPDIVGGTGMATGRFGDESKEKLRVYLMRYAQYAALNPSMSFGYGPWNFDDEVVEVTLQAAQLHGRLQPYIFSNAIKAYKTGFPYPMTPLPLAFPKEELVYSLADTNRRSYQWMIGESLLATPLYGGDYATAKTRNVYLPEGTWIEYDNGQLHEGPSTLENYPLPVGKTPLFVGGNGIVVETKEGQLKARIYPVAAQAEMEFYSEDGTTRSVITVDNPDWNNLQVINQTDNSSPAVKKVNHAFEFNMVPGNDYLVE